MDKDRVDVVLNELHGPSRHTVGSSSSSRPILLISLERLPFFDKMYSEIISTLRSKVGIMEVAYIASAIYHISKGRKKYSAVVLTDPAVMEDDLLPVQESPVEYATLGGTVILGFLFSNFAQPEKNVRFFKKIWNLDWKCGDYARSMFTLNPRANPVFLNGHNPNLPRQYSMKAVHLMNTEPEDRVYVASPGSA